MSDTSSTCQDDRRTTFDRRTGSRDKVDRREMVGIQLDVSCQTDIVQSWLQDNCKESFQLVLIDVSDDLKFRTIEVMFSSIDDRDLFNANSHDF